MKVVQEANSESTMLSLVAAGIGVTLITEAVKRRKPDGVVLIPVDDLDLQISLKAMWRSDDKTPAVSKFMSITRRCVDSK